MGFYAQTSVDPQVRQPENAPPRMLTVGSGHRDYNPEIGRWTSRDPIGERGGLLLYGFVGNEPVSRRDVLGLMDLWSKDELTADDKKWVFHQQAPEDAECSYDGENVFGAAGDKMTEWERSLIARYTAVMSGLGSENNPFTNPEFLILEQVLEALSSAARAAANNLTSLRGKQYTYVAAVYKFRKRECVCSCENIWRNGIFRGLKMGWKCEDPKELDFRRVELSASEMQIRGEPSTFSGTFELLFEELKENLKDINIGPQ